MKKVLFLITFLFICLGIVSAQEELSKTFPIASNGIVKITPQGSMLSVQIIYNKISDAPKPVQQKLGAVAPNEKAAYVPLQFSIKFLNDDGAQLCSQVLLFSDFNIDDTDEQPKAVLQYQAAGQCGIESYSKISSVVVDYNNIGY